MSANNLQGLKVNVPMILLKHCERAEGAPNTVYAGEQFTRVLLTLGGHEQEDYSNTVVCVT